MRLTKWKTEQTIDQLGQRLDRTEDDEDLGHEAVRAENDLKTNLFQRIAALPGARVDKFSDEAIAERKAEAKKAEEAEIRRQGILKRTWNAQTTELMQDFK